MKIRTDFVTNSSSSSFIVAFDKIPKSAEEVEEMLFCGKTKSYKCCYYKEEWDTSIVAKTVYNMILEQESCNFDEIVKNIDGHVDEHEFEDEDGKLDWKSWSQAMKANGEEKAKEFIYKYLNHPIYVFRFADEDGAYFGALEHGNLFRLLPHLVRSNH